MSLREKLRVLVVDDMSVSRGLLEQALDQIGMKNVAYATDGMNALEKISKSPVHLVISDFNMPNMDGLQLLERLRKHPATQKTGFILVTGTEDRAVIERGKGLGMNNYIPKPFTPQTLQACIERVTGKL